MGADGAFAPAPSPGPRTLLVDARGLFLSGIGRYLREVLAAALRDPRFAHFTLLGRPDELRGFLDGQAGRVGRASVIPFAHPFYSPGAQLHWAALGARGALRAHAAYFPHYDVPVPPPHPPSVVTVHDLAHFRLPDVFPWWKRAAASPVLAGAVRRASRVLVPSEAAGRDVAARHPGVAAKLRVIPQGVSAEFGAAPRDPRAEAAARALRPYLLCVGNRKPHKNLATAVEVLARLRPRHPGLRLVLVGAHFPGQEDRVRARAEALGVSGAVVDAGAVGDEELRSLYAAAECFLFPSVFEGFGIPVLEAMSLGAPVVASNRESIPEVVGDAGVLVDAMDAEAMAAEVERVLAGGGHREELVRRGARRAAELTWARTAASTLDEIWRVASKRR